ncbi:isoprenoid synthase domain-containing protein [Aspergillus egyptiacus]|nr:isoprenoid synthase domain-containing protein [Aspergillus egyptiacus]
MDAIPSHCRYSDPLDIRTYKTQDAEWFSLYPVYLSRYESIAINASKETLARLTEAAEKDGLEEPRRLLYGCQTPLGNFTAWAYPESLPERLSLCTSYCDFAYFWDDVTDTLGLEKLDEVTQDLALAVLSALKPGQPVEPKFAINKLAQQYMRDLMDGHGELGITLMKAWGKHLDTQQTSRHNDMSFEQMGIHRFREGGVIWAIELGRWAADLHCSQQELDSVRPIIDAGGVAGIITNDYYSFNKEFDAHQRTGTLDRMQNAVGLLMREYGYTEDEARSILRQEINKGEKQFIDGYKAWESAPGPKSDSLRRYLIMVMQLFGGTIFWMAHAPRYHHELLTTAEDRATIVGKAHGPLRVLEGYPPPKGLKRLGSSLDLTATTTVNKRRNSSESPSASKHINGVKSTPEHPMALYTAPFVKAPTEICDAPYEYINSLQSKNTRNKFIDTLNTWLRVPSESLQVIKNIVSMLHNTSLMLDDVEDLSSLRRGHPATHVFYGMSQTINSANFTYVKVVRETTRLRSPNAMEIFLDELTNLHCGQSYDLHWRHQARCPTTEEYIIMVDNKTGGLFRLMLRLMHAESSTSSSTTPTPSLTRLLTLTGRYYQIRDDYLNLTSSDYTSKKGFCEDLDEGKFSLPLIHLLEHTPHPDRITAAIYNHRGGCAAKLTREVKRHILDEMESARTLDYVREVIAHLHGEIMATLNEVERELGTNEAARGLLVGLGL